MVTKFGIIILLIIIIPLYVGMKYIIKVIQKNYITVSEYKYRYKQYYIILNKWLQNRNNSIYIFDKLQRDNCSCVAIYGLGELGNRLYEELKLSDVKVKYFVDQNASENQIVEDSITVIKIEDLKKAEQVDQIIITPIFAFSSIQSRLIDEGIDATKIKSLEQIIYE